MALLTAPLLTIAILLALSLTSPIFLPAIITAKDKVSLLVPGIIIGLVVAFFEELGWTGFAIPELRKRYSVLAVGLLLGLPWGLWHFPLFAASAHSSGTIPPALYMAVLLFSWLPPYRVLMVWAYDHTKSLLMLMIMHLPIVVDQFVLRAEAASGVALCINLLLFGSVLWVIAAVVLRLDYLKTQSKGERLTWQAGKVI
jgi:membrane protease YdiL (CAAX protease family)